jgi:hypothetical protein
MKPTLSLMALIALLSSVACETQPGTVKPAPSQSKTDASKQAAVSAELEALDRKQASYLTTSVHSSNDTHFLEGRAQLQVLPKGSRAEITLDIIGVRKDAQPWRGSFPLAESQLLGNEAGLSRAPASLSAAKHTIDGHLSGERANRASLAIAREAQPKMRPALHGHVLFEDGASAEFRSEYDLHCLVPFEMLGQESNIVQDADSHAQILTEDDHFQSAFCQQFAALR